MFDSDLINPETAAEMLRGQIKIPRDGVSVWPCPEDPTVHLRVLVDPRHHRRALSTVPREFKGFHVSVEQRISREND